MQIKHLTIGTEYKSNILQLVQNANNTSFNWYGMQIKHSWYRMQIKNILQFKQNANNTSYNWYRMQIKHHKIGTECK